MPTALKTEPSTLPQPAQEAWGSIQGRVSVVRQRHRAKFLLTGACLVLAIVAAAFLGFSLVDILFKLSVGGRIFWLAVALGGAAAAAVLCIVRPWSQLGGPVALAKQVEHAYPELEDQLSTAIEYGGDARAQAASSPELVGALIAQARQRSEPLDFTRTVRWKRAAWAALAAFLVSAGVALYAQANPRLFRTTWERFFNPTAAVAPPTLTLIEKVERLQDGQPVPAAGEVPVETSVPLIVTLDGRIPETVTLAVLSGEDAEQERLEQAEPASAPRWEERILTRGDDGRYHGTLRRLLDTVRFKVKAGDAESEEYRIDVFREPQVDEFSLELKYPAYTGKAAETLPAGQGDVKALRGTQVTVRFKANTELGAAQMNFESGRTPAAASLDGRNGQFRFVVDADDRYQFSVTDAKGRGSRSAASYRVKALEDGRPRVRIMKPARDLMVHRGQSVQIEISASDDVGVGEAGLFHSLGLSEEKTMVRRWEPAPGIGKATLKWELGNLGLKGGEVLAYYAYALDNDTVTGPKMAKSDIHFLTVYDEEEYDAPQDPDQQKNPPTPQAVKTLDKMIEVQKKLLQVTFGQAKVREEKAEKKEEPTEREAADIQRTGKEQAELRKQLDELAAEVKAEMERIAAEGAPEPAPGEEEQPQALGEKELKHMAEASQRMVTASEKLHEVKPASAVNPEIEALRHLSETRRLLLSDKEGDPRFKQAMNQQSKKNKKNQRKQQDEDMQSAREELAQLPPMLEREKDTEREIEELENRSLERPEDPAEQQQQEQEKRELQKQVKDQLDEMLEELNKREENVRELARRNPELDKAAEHLQNAKEQTQQAKENVEKEKLPEAKENMRQAQRETQQAQREMRDFKDKQLRQQLANLEKDAQDMAQRQEQMANESREMQRQMSQQGQPQQNQPQQGQPQEGQPQEGQPQEGQPQQGQPQQGQPQQGQPSAQQQQRMQAMAGRQQELNQDQQDLTERMAQAQSRLRSEGLPGAQALEEAQRMAGEQSPGQKSAEQAEDELRKGRAEQAEREQRKAERALDAAARAVQAAAQQVAAADMKKLNEALEKARNLAKEQGEINAALEKGAESNPARQAERENKIAQASRELASAAEKMEALKEQSLARSAKETLETAAKHADEAAKALEGQDVQEAKKPAENAEKSLQAAVNAMERAAGKTLEEKAKEAQAIAEKAREHQEQAAAGAKELPEPADGKPLAGEKAEKRDQAADAQRAAAREARKLEKALEGLADLAKESNPAAEQAARDAKETAEEAKLPTAMDDLAKDLEQTGKPEIPGQPKAPAPKESAAKGEQLAQTVKEIEKDLERVVAEARNDLAQRIQKMREDAKDAAERAKEMSEQAEGKPQNPDGKPQQPADTEELAKEAQELMKDLSKLEPRLEHLDKEAPELKDLREAQKKLAEAKTQAEQQDPNNPSPAEQQRGGAALKHVQKHMQQVAGGLLQRLERIERAREVKPLDGDEAPASYEAIGNQYFESLSKDGEPPK